MGGLGFSASTSRLSTGPGGDYCCSLVLAEELVRGRSGGLTMGVAVQTDMALPPILKVGTEEQKHEWAAQAIAGQRILALGMSEPDAGSDVAGIRTRAVYDSVTGEYVINGSKTYIANGHRADLIVLVTRTDANSGPPSSHPPSLPRRLHPVLVPMDLRGVIREKRLEKLGMHASDTALLAFQDVRVPASAVLGDVGKGFYQIMWELRGERLISSAAAVAGAGDLRSHARIHQAARRVRAADRQVPGDPPQVRGDGNEIETARQLTYTTAWRFQNGEYPVREISMAKLYASRIACEVADDCLQIHGGAGYMREHGIERAWRDLRLNRIGAGTDELMLEVIDRSYDL